jgi:AcrR family transcriptional regulator
LDPTKARLLEAAGQEFAEKGYANATVRAICSRAGVNLAAVNYHFGDKEQLYTQAVLEAHRCGIAELSELDLEGRSIEQQLQLFIERFLQHVFTDPTTSWHYQIIMHEIVHPSHACEVLVRERVRPRFAILTRIMRQLAPGADDKRLLALCFSLVGQCLYYRIGRPIAERIVGPEVLASFDVEYLANHITQFTLAALGRGPSFHEGHHVAARTRFSPFSE